MARRDEILDALISIFRQEGIGSDFTISQLASKVNIGKSTIYEYFKTKDEILKEAISRVFDQSLQKINDHPLTDEPFEVVFKNELDNLFNLAVNSRFLFNIVTPSFRKLIPEEHKEDMTSRMKGVTKFYNARFEEIFSKGVQEGLLTPELLLENQLLIQSLVTGSIMRLANANLELSVDLSIKEYIDKVYNVVLKMCN